MPEFSPLTGQPQGSRLRGRLDAQRSELRRLHDALARRPHPAERAILAGALLGTAGYLIRRSQALAVDGGDSATAVDTALQAIAREDLAAWLAGASTAGLRQALQRAADAAFEVTLNDEDNEREGHREAALEGLAERETLASALQAIRRWEELNSPLEDRAARRREALESEVAAIDAALRPAAVALTALNDERRAERDQLDGFFRAQSWWYSHHADNDEMLTLMVGSSLPAASPGEQPRTRALLALTQSPPRRHLSEEELWAYDLGTMNKDQRAWVSRHAAACPDCKRTIRALSEGDDAIEEALGAAPRRAAPEPDQEVAFEHPQFRALVFRGARKIRLFIEEKSPSALLSITSPASTRPRRLRGGFELEVPSGNADVPLNLRVTLANRDEVAVELSLRAKLGLTPGPSPGLGRGEREREWVALSASGESLVSLRATHSG